MGGFTLQIRTPDSWEGWYWGAKHVWGMESVGLQWPDNANILPDVCKNSDLLLFWGADPETTPWGFGGGQFTSRICYHIKEIEADRINRGGRERLLGDVRHGTANHRQRRIGQILRRGLPQLHDRRVTQ